MTFATTMLLSFCLLLTYTWLVYPFLLVIYRGLFKRDHRQEQTGVSFSLIIAAYNEEDRIREKLENCLALDYAQDLVEIIVASDGSTDATETIVGEFAALDSRISLLRSAGRAGKSGVQNLAASTASAEVLLFTDVETIAQPDLLRRVAAHFADPRIGMVAPVVHFGRAGSAVSQGQGAYWRFELFLRQLESDLGILATCSGSAFAIRRHLFRPIPSQYGDDCITPLDIRLLGYLITQDPEIIVYDEMPHSIEGELRARIRMTARNWAGILSRPRVLNPFRFPVTSWGLISHKFLRWMTPFFLALLYFVNCGLAFHHRFIYLLVVQTCFYVAAVVGWRRSRSESCEPMFGYPFAFCLANVGFFLGVVKCLRGQRVVAYK
jgi:cellulose synthase/poly-beta-1,6-N-acetylglucosamine synthase-like glycosyltransferase